MNFKPPPDLVPLVREPLRIGLFGEFSAGKSTLLNSLLGQDLQATGVVPTTQQVAVIHHPSRADLSGPAYRGIGRGQLIPLEHDLLWLGGEIWDTPGPGSEDSGHEQIALRAAAQLDIRLMLIAANDGVTRTAVELWQRLAKAEKVGKKPTIYVVFTKFDRMEAEDEEEATELREELIEQVVEHLGEGLTTFFVDGRDLDKEDGPAMRAVLEHGVFTTAQSQLLLELRAEPKTHPLRMETAHQRPWRALLPPALVTPEVEGEMDAWEGHCAAARATHTRNKWRALLGHPSEMYARGASLIGGGVVRGFFSFGPVAYLLSPLRIDVLKARFQQARLAYRAQVGLASEHVIPDWCEPLGQPDAGSDAMAWTGFDWSPTLATVLMVLIGLGTWWTMTDQALRRACRAGDAVACVQLVDVFHAARRPGAEVPAGRQACLLSEDGAHCVKMAAHLAGHSEAGEQTLKELLEHACTAGDVVGCSALAVYLDPTLESLPQVPKGLLMRRGIADQEEAAAALVAACTLGAGEACVVLDHRVRAAPPRTWPAGTVAALQRSCDAGRPTSCASMALAAMAGIVEMTGTAAREHLSAACLSGATEYCEAAGDAWFVRVMGTPDSRRALEARMAGCRAGERELCDAALVVLLSRRARARSVPAAAMLLRDLCVAEDDVACTRLVDVGKRNQRQLGPGPRLEGAVQICARPHMLAPDSSVDLCSAARALVDAWDGEVIDLHQSTINTLHKWCETRTWPEACPLAAAMKPEHELALLQRGCASSHKLSCIKMVQRVTHLHEAAIAGLEPRPSDPPGVGDEPTAILYGSARSSQVSPAPSIANLMGFINRVAKRCETPQSPISQGCAALMTGVRQLGLKLQAKWSELFIGRCRGGEPESCLWLNRLNVKDGRFEGAIERACEVGCEAACSGLNIHPRACGNTGHPLSVFSEPIAGVVPPEDWWVAGHCETAAECLLLLHEMDH
jgi:GTPase SAR1 family protein